MFENLIALLKQPSQQKALPSPRLLQQAGAALLYEVARADNTVSDEEVHQLLQRVRDQWQLDDNVARELFEHASTRAEEATDLFQFTRLLNDHWDMEEKVALVKMMWDVAFADGILDAHEEYLIRKVADLLYLPHAAYIESKLSAQPDNNNNEC